MHATLFLVGKAASVFVFGVSLPCLVYFLSFCTKNGLGGRVMDQANYSACRPRSSASHSSCCSVWSFSDKLGRRKKMANQKALLFFPVFLYPITFLCPSINFPPLLSRKKKLGSFCVVSKKSVWKSCCPLRNRKRKHFLNPVLNYTRTSIHSDKCIVSFWKADICQKSLLCFPPPHSFTGILVREQYYSN